MVKSVIDDVTTYYPSAAYQVKTDGTYTNTRKYYSFNGAVVAMRENGVITWLLQDKVNSTTITADANGNLLSETRYSAFGEVRYSNGTMVTDKLYTGQQQETEIGLDYYIARFYDPVIGHFIQADSIIPNMGNAQAYDRFAYVYNNPINFNDPSGNRITCDQESGLGCHSTGMGDLTPIQIISTYSQPNTENRAIYNYSVTHPNYNYYSDPSLEDTGKLIVANAIFLGTADYVSRKSTIAERIKSVGGTIAAGASLSLAGIAAGGGIDLDGNNVPTIPSHTGRLGGLQHRSSVNGIIENVENDWGQGYYASGEIYFSTAGGMKTSRYGDVGIFNPNGDLAAVYQVGLSTCNGSPIARERYAINDLFEFGFFKGNPFNGPIIFIPYK